MIRCPSPIAALQDLALKLVLLQAGRGFFIFWFEGANLRVQQIAEKQRGFPCSFRNFPRPVRGERVRVRAKPTPPLSLFTRDKYPADLLGVG